MPMAVPTMPDSASGVSKTRVSPNLAASPSVTRKTPPSGPTSSPKTRTRSSSRSASRSAVFRACAIVNAVMSVLRCGQLGREQLPLLAQLGGGLGEDVIEQLERVRLRVGVHLVAEPGSELLAGLLRRGDVLVGEEPPAAQVGLQA